MALFINGVGQDTFNMNGVSIDNLYVDGVLVWTSVAPPVVGGIVIYELTESLIDYGGFKWLVNSAEGATTYNGKLLTSTDTAWNPTAQEYPANATAVIDFGTNYADTEWTPPSNAEYTFTFVEDVADNSYNMVSINAKGDGSTADVLYDGVLTAENTGLNYTPPAESVKLTENMSQTIVPIECLCTIEMSQYAFYEGDTATVTFTWNTVPVGFDLPTITAQNGSISNLAQDTDSPWIYTATFTPDPDVSDGTNHIIVYIGAFGIDDAWGNSSNTDPVSANYTVDTISVVEAITYINVDTGAETFPYTVNEITSLDLSDAPADMLDSEGNTTGISITLIAEFEGSANGVDVSDNCLGDARFADKCYVNFSTTIDRGFTLNLPSGTYDFLVLSDVDSSSTTRVGNLTFDGVSKIHDASTNNTGSKCLLWEGVVGGRGVDFTVKANTGATAGEFNAVKITKVG